MLARNDLPLVSSKKTALAQVNDMMSESFELHSTER